LFNYTKITITMFIIITIIASILISCEKSGYTRNFPSGKDTMKYFGDGTFQILRDSENKTNELFNNRSDNTFNRVVEPNVKDYVQIKEKVYVFGEKGYTILNLDTFDVKQSQSLDGFSEEEQKIFKDLE
jgi:hypothetical protein